MAEIEVTEENVEEVRQAIIFTAAVVAHIRARLDKYGEAIVDDAVLLKIWGGKPWLSATGNLHDRIKNLAKEMEAKVSWPKKGEARFTRKIPIIHVVGAN